MSISAKTIPTAVLLFVAGFIAASLLAAFMIARGGNANAQALACIVDEGLVTKIYDVVFKRPVDDAGRAYIGQEVGFMIDEMAKSQEHNMYSGMFKAMKAMEEAERQPGAMAAADKAQFRNMLDSAMSNISSWSQTLPEQAAADAIIGPEHAREALNFAHNMIPAEFREMAKFSFFDPTKMLGAPTDFAIPEQFRLKFADAELRLQQEIRERIDTQQQYRMQIEDQYKLREQQEAEFLKEYGRADFQLTPEQQEAFVMKHMEFQPASAETTAGATTSGGTTAGGGSAQSY